MSAFESMKYGPIGEAVAAAVPESEADPVGIYAAVLALYSSALAGYVVMENGRPAVVWTVLAGRSSAGRKGYALGTARKVLAKSIGGFLDARTFSGISSGPSLVNQLFQLELETAGTETGQDGRALLLEEEWPVVLKRARRCPTFSQHLRTAWDGKRISNIVKGKGGDGVQEVERPLLGMHAHITPGEWARYVDGTDALGGSFNRILPVMVETSKRLPWNHRERIEEHRALTAAYRWARREPRVMQLMAEAGRRYDELRDLIEERLAGLPERVSCYMERSAEQVLRVAAVLTAAEMKTKISRKAIEAAWAFVSYSMNSVERLVSEAANGAGSREVKELPDVIREILARYDGEATGTMMLRALGVKASAALLKATVEGMDDVVMVRERLGGRGAPATIYRLVEPGPAVVEQPKPTKPAEVVATVEPSKPVVIRTVESVVEPKTVKAKKPKTKKAGKSKKLAASKPRLSVVAGGPETERPAPKPKAARKASPKPSAPAEKSVNPFLALL
ncbi:DUF3987 domain-containing protein [Kitasatospora sp. NPDC001095]